MDRAFAIAFNRYFEYLCFQKRQRWDDFPLRF